MASDSCVAIASDLRFGADLSTISMNFSKVHQIGPKLFVGFPGLATDNQTVYVCVFTIIFLDINVLNFAKIFMN